MKRSSLIKSIALAAASASLLVPGAAVANKKMEKCYGVVKAGKNDCSSTKNKHSCAGGAVKDGDKAEWVLVPTGTCDKLVNGSTKES